MPDIQVLRCYDFDICIPSGDWMLTAISAESVYEPWVIGAFREHCPGAHVLDVGANVGVFAMSAAKAGARKVTAVDASPENAKLITANAALNGFDNVEVLPFAASDRFGMARFLRTPDSNKVVHDYALTPDTFDTIDVALSAPLDAIVRERVDVFKIDIEGHEYRALRGAQAILDMRPVVFVEFSPVFQRTGSGADTVQFMAEFFGRGYRATLLNRDMSREDAGQDLGRILAAYDRAMAQSVTHVDLMMRPSF